MKQYPWEYHPDLTARRLIDIAILLRHGRHDAVERHDEEIGDDNWTLGVRAYNCGRFRITEAHASDRFPWLTIINPTLQFIFGIGLVPVRFYRGDADEPSDKTCRVAYPELNQLAIAFPEEEGDDMVFRFAVETDWDGSVIAIKFVGLRHKQTVFCWEVPLPTADIVRFTPIEIADDGVILPAPQVGLPGDEEEVAKDTG